MLIYSDKLENGWQSQGFTQVNYASLAYVHSGSYSISVYATKNKALTIHHDRFFNDPFQALSFFINPRSATGVQVLVQGTLNSVAQAGYTVPVLAPNTWTAVTVTLQALGVANQSLFDGIQIVLVSDIAANFYVDDIALVGIPLPSITNVVVDSSTRLSTVDVRHFGVNTAVSDGLVANSDLRLQEGGFTSLRFPGGMIADDFDWTTSKSIRTGYQYPTSFDDFASVAISTKAKVFITVNYGTGTPQLAASWVAAATEYNYSGFQYFEVGNENYGSWEADNNNRSHDPVTYATRFVQYMTQMKAVNPTIKVGAVAVPYEDNFVNYVDQVVTNPRTGLNRSGWTPVLLATFKRLGQYPDFLIHHKFAQQPGSECDAILLQSARSWKIEAAGLRQQLNDYLGKAVAAGIELVVTQTDSVYSNPGKQTTSLVSALYFADSIGQLLYTEFKGQIWWNLRSYQAQNNNNPLLYGWRAYGDYGVLNSNTRYPTFYASKILKNFARPGDSVVRVSSKNPLLGVYATIQQAGSLALLVINKSLMGAQKASFSIFGFGTGTYATAVYTYGKTQDTSAFSGDAVICSLSLNVSSIPFTYTFQPYSITVLVLSPASQ